MTLLIAHTMSVAQIKEIRRIDCLQLTSFSKGRYYSKTVVIATPNLVRMLIELAWAHRK